MTDKALNLRYKVNTSYQGYTVSCGYTLSAKGQKRQKDFYLGDDQSKALQLYLVIKGEWDSCKTKGNPIWTAESLEKVQAFKANLYGSTAVHLPKPTVVIEPVIQTFYQLIDEYIQNVIPNIACNKLHKEHLRQRIGWLKRCTNDFPIDKLDYNQLSKMTNYWKSRPNNRNAEKNKKTSEPISIATVDIAISTLKRFCNWLYEAEKWDGFRGWQRLLNLSNYKPELTDKELLAQSKAVVGKENSQRFTIEELQILYQNASPITQKYMLFALNCGFTQLEISSLMRGECFMNNDPPIIARGRHKTTKINKPISSKWRLWDETIEVCKNLLEGKIADFEHNGIAAINTKDGSSHAVYLPKNLPLKIKKSIIENQHIGGVCELPERNWLFGRELVYNNQDHIRIDLIRNNWFRLLNKLEGKVRPLGFKYLRKTGSDMIKEIAGAEIADLYLSHAPKSTGGRHYYGQSYDKLFDALIEMRKRLEPMFKPLPKEDKTGDSQT